MKLNQTFLIWRRAVGIRCYEMLIKDESRLNTSGWWNYRSVVHRISTWLVKISLGTEYHFQTQLWSLGFLEALQSAQVSVTVKGRQQISRLHDLEEPE